MLDKYIFKCIIIGDAGVGKSSLMANILNDGFVPVYTSTIGVEYGSYDALINNKYNIKLQIWDTAGQETYHSITRCYYNKTSCVMIVFDITNRKSFESIPYWIKKALDYCSENISILLVGNKEDLSYRRTVTYNEAYEVAKYFNINYIEASAKTGFKVYDSFNNIIHNVYSKLENGEIDPSDDSYGVRLLQTKNRSNEVKKKKNCCTIL